MVAFRSLVARARGEGRRGSVGGAPVGTRLGDIVAGQKIDSRTAAVRRTEAADRRPVFEAMHSGFGVHADTVVVVGDDAVKVTGTPTQGASRERRLAVEKRREERRRSWRQDAPIYIQTGRGCYGRLVVHGTAAVRVVWVLPCKRTTGPETWGHTSKYRRPTFCVAGYFGNAVCRGGNCGTESGAFSQPSAFTASGRAVVRSEQ